MSGPTERQPSSPTARVTARYANNDYVLLHYDESDHIINQVGNSGRFYEEDLLIAASRFLKPGDLVLDIGANIGNHTVFFAGALGCRVIAFEPNPDASNLLAANVRANELQDLVEIETIGLGARKSAAEVQSDVAHNLGAAHLELSKRGEIAVKRLDSIRLPAPPALFKIDVEGMEVDVFKGALKTIEKHKPVICCEIASQSNLSEVGGLIESLGYVSLESLCYTPTHVFVHVEETRQLEAVLDIVSRLSSRSALNHYEADRRLSRIHRFVQNDLSNLEKRISNQVDSLKENLVAQTEAALTDSLTGGLGEIQQRLESIRVATDRLHSLDNQLSSIVYNIEASHQSSVSPDQFSKGLAEQSAFVDSKLAATAESLGKQIASLTQSEVRGLQTTISSTNDAMSDLLGVAKTSSDLTERAVLPKIEGLYVELEKGVTRTSLTEALDERIDQIKAKLGESSEELGNLVAHLNETVSENTNDLSLLLGAQSEEIKAGTQDLSSRLEAYSGEVKAGTQDLSSRLEAYSGEVKAGTQDLSSRLEAYSGEVKAGTQDLSRRFEDQSNHLNSELGQLIKLSASESEMLESLEASALNSYDAAGALLAIQKNQMAADLPPCLTRSVDQAPAHICFLNFHFDKSWHEWTYHQNVDLSAPGRFVSRQSHSTPGVRSPIIRGQAFGLYQVRVTSQFDLGQCRPFVRVVAAGTHELLGPDHPLTPGETLFRYYQPERIDAIQVFILLEGPKKSASVSLEEVRLERVDMESHQAWVSGQVDAPVIASMATIPSRIRMLKDAVYSLLVQCDEVRVYMNNYDSVPEFLHHPRIKIRRSQHWDDNGDAGKFGWIDENEAPGYRIICDDDLLFPPDLIERLVGKVKETDDRAMVGLHGVMLRQPISQYYAPNSRHAVHFQSRMDTPKLVQILATCVMCYHSSQMTLRRDDFMFRNMADVWLSAYAKNNGIPLMIIDRPFKWVRQNTQEGGFETIYENSLKRTKSNFDSSYIQDAVLKSVAPLTLQKLDRNFHAMVIAADSRDAFDDFMTSFHATRDQGKEWLIIVVLKGQSEELREYVQTMPFTHELHIVDSQSDDPTDAARELATLLSKLHYDMAFFATDRLRFKNDDWCRIPIEENWLSETDFLSFSSDGTNLTAVSGTDAWTDFCVFSKAAEGTFSNERGSEKDENLITVAVNALSSLISVATGEDISDKVPKEPPLVAKLAARALQDCIIQTDPGRSQGDLPIVAPHLVRARQTGRSVNEVFDRVVVLNLDRRPDRWKQAQARLAKVGISVERFRAVDGKWPEIDEDYREYCMSPLRDFSDEPGRIGRYREFYLYAKSESQRTAFLEQRSQFKAIARPGAWGYLKSMIGILEAAIADGVENLLIFDDDFILHRQFNELFAAAMGELPEDWRILQLGTLQYDWDRRWMRWYSDHLYSSLGVAIGSHAVGLKREILPFLLERSKRLEMPYDIGPLSAAARANPTRNFIIYPNIAIQDLSDSDISSSSYQENTELDRVFQQYRWNREDYDFEH